METSKGTELGEAGHFAGCWTYPLGLAVVGRQLYFSDRAAAMTNLGLSPFSFPGHSYHTTEPVCCVEQAGGGD